MLKTNELDLITERGLKKRQTKKDVNDMFCSVPLKEVGILLTLHANIRSIFPSLSCIKIVLLPAESERVNWIFVFPSLESLAEMISSSCFSLSGKSGWRMDKVPEMPWKHEKMFLSNHSLTQEANYQ